VLTAVIQCDVVDMEVAHECFWVTMRRKTNKGHGNHCLMVIVGALFD